MPFAVETDVRCDLSHFARGHDDLGEHRRQRDECEYRTRGRVPVYRDIPLGGNRYSEAAQREMGVSFEEAEQLKKSDRDDDHTLTTVMESVNAEVASEIARTIDYFKTTSSESEITRVLLCGGGAKVRGLAQQLRDRMHVDVDIANPFNRDPHPYVVSIPRFW